MSIRRHALILFLVGVMLSLPGVAAPAADDGRIRLASLEVIKRPPPARRQMTITERSNETVVSYPTARAKAGVVLAVDNCLTMGAQCGQPAADAVCRINAPGRPVAASYKPLQGAGATVILSSKEYCWGDVCVGLSEVRCVSATLPDKTRVSDTGMATSMAVPAASSAGATTVVNSPPMAVDPNACKTGFVWREARPADLVCVTPEARQRTREENAAAASRVDPNGAWGPASCKSGHVWREAFDGDTVCVPPEVRDQVRAENRAGSANRVGQ